MSQPAAPFGNDLRAALVAMVRKRVPESEVEDIVQSALAEAIESPHAPKESEALRRWIFGVAKHKVVDYHRRAGRESFDMPEVAGSPAPHVEADLLRWAERNIPDSPENQKTLDWMLREGEGEKLESIAASEKLPAPRVRQRVSRLRRHLKDNWQREVALLAALGVIVSAVVFLVLRKKDPDVITHDPTYADPRALEIRKAALQRCAASEWKACIEGLDEAKRLDAAGDSAPEVRRAREDAAKALTPSPSPSSSAAPPSPTTAPPPAPTAMDFSNPSEPVPLDAKAVSPLSSAMPPTRAPTKFGKTAPVPTGELTAAPTPTPPPPTNAAPLAPQSKDGSGGTLQKPMPKKSGGGTAKPSGDPSSIDFGDSAGSVAPPSKK